MDELKRRIQTLAKVREGEFKPFLLSFAYFFCILCGYYILRPIRDEMGIQGGVRNLQWVFTATFLVMLLAVPVFGWAGRRFKRINLVPAVYVFFVLNLAVFYALFNLPVPKIWLGRVFFIWVSVYNLFVVSVFWSFMADIYSSEQAERLFGGIAAGGSAGAITGPALTALLSSWLDPIQLIPLSAGFLLLAVLCVRLLSGKAADPSDEKSPTESSSDARENERSAPLSGSVWSGALRVVQSPYMLGVVIFIILFTTLSTFLYFQQAYIIKDAFATSAERTRVFAIMDLATNVLTVLAQLFVTSRIVTRLGMAAALMLVPILLALGFLALGLFPILSVILIIQVLRRAGNYAVTRPAREMLFTVLPAEDKYKSKNFIDTVV